MNMSCGKLKKGLCFCYSIESGMTDYFNMVRQAASLPLIKERTTLAEDRSIQWERGCTNGGTMRCD
jgi:hypothetical protein